MTVHRGPGRPLVTSHAAIEAAAFALFDLKGFDATTMEDIADSLGVGRRTLFRYYPSKNDIPWGQFDASLEQFRASLRSMPRDIPMYEAVHRAVLDFNRFEDAALPQHRRRMELLLRTPALEAHSVLRYHQWREVIAEYVAERLECRPSDPIPRVVGQVSLALAISSYELWLDAGEGSLAEILDQALSNLRDYLRE